MASLYRVRTAIAGGTGSSQLSTHFFNDDGVLTAQNAATAVRNFWDFLKTRINSAYTMQVEHEVARVDTATGKVTDLVAVTGLVVTGTDAANALPWATQGLCKWSTGHYISGRQVKGHTFVPGPTQNSLVNGVPSAAYIADLTTASGNLISDVNSEFMIYSRKNTQGVQVTIGTGWSKWAVLTSRRD